ncbi:hypothetical protein ACFWPV_36965 [Streptomyces uncialis]|uniref:hypothetical protein n=1 Tax=Streptomyces uncialis TaxID=1048205 RepID=UPI00364CD31D
MEVAGEEVADGGDPHARALVDRGDGAIVRGGSGGDTLTGGANGRDGGPSFWFNLPDTSNNRGPRITYLNCPIGT